MYSSEDSFKRKDDSLLPQLDAADVNVAEEGITSLLVMLAVVSSEEKVATQLHLSLKCPKLA